MNNAEIYLSNKFLNDITNIIVGNIVDNVKQYSDNILNNIEQFSTILINLTNNIGNNIDQYCQYLSTIF